MGNGQTGNYELGSGVTTASISLPFEANDADYKILGSIINETDVTSSIYDFIITNRTTTSFDIELTGETDSANYIFSWIVTSDGLSVTASPSSNIMSQYTSVELSGSSNILSNVIPANSVIMSIVVQVTNDVPGTITLDTNTSPSSRILRLDYITGEGIYTGNSSKGYFTDQQSINVTTTGGLETVIKILFWET